MKKVLRVVLQTNKLEWGRGGGLVDRAADLAPRDPSSIPLGENKGNKCKEA